MNTLQKFLLKLNEALNFIASILTYILIFGLMLFLIWFTFGDYYQGQWEFFNDYHNNRTK
jgi:TRAP-type C4-dicarboxylate transport system permease small subunit